VCVCHRERKRGGEYIFVLREGGKCMCVNVCRVLQREGERERERERDRE